VKTNLSKSKYIKGLKCHKALWLDKHKPELKADASAQTQQNFAVGHQVGDLAKQLFLNGVEIEFDTKNFPSMIAKTKQLITEGESVIYEATFSENSVFAMVDILVKNGSAWDIYEVKSSTSVKDVYIDDVSVQGYALSGVLNIGRCYVVHINNQYVRQGELDIRQLFTIAEVTDRLKSSDEVESKLKQMQQMLANDEPDIDIGTHCSSPYDCDFKPYCWQHIPQPSVFNLSRIGKKKFDYYSQGKITYQDIQLENLSSVQSVQVDSYLNDKVHIDKSVIESFISDVVYPINFFDFETFQNAVPRFDGQKPYAQMPFQYSLHILHEDGALEHKEFLGSEFNDPRQDLIQNMLADITEVGSIIAYNQSFEIGRIKDLAVFAPQYKDELLAFNSRFLDLIVPFRKLGYYHKNFQGSFSIKSVLPAMFPNDDELDYKKLEIQDGGMAMDTFANLHLVDDEKERAKIRHDLLKYCHLDTLAMVRVFQKLNSLLK
jgi:hypothetical protein